MATHRLSGTPTYRSWMAMKRRCTYPRHPAYHLYGGRGISVCPQWLNSFETFLADMGPRPRGCSLDRFDNAKGYDKSNCRWADKYTQANNRDTTTLLTVDGVTKPLAEWSRVTGLKPSTIRERVKRGWSHDRCIAAKPSRIKVTIGGRTQWLSDFARENGIAPETATARVRSGMSPEDAVTKPLMDTRFKTGHTFWEDFNAQGRRRGEKQEANQS